MPLRIEDIVNGSFDSNPPFSQRVSVVTLPPLSLATGVVLQMGDTVGLVAGTAQVGSVTVSNPVSLISIPTIFVVNQSSSGTTVYQGTNPWTVSFNQLISLSSGTELRSLATILNFPTGFNVNNSPTVLVTNLVSVASITGIVSVTNLVSVSSINGLLDVSKISNLASTATLFAVVGVVGVESSVVTISPRTDYFGLVSVSGNVNLIGVVSLASGSELRSLATILNFPATQAVTQSGNWDIRSLLSTASIYGKVDLGGTSDIRSLLSLASIFGLVGNAAGANYIGLVTATIGGGLISLASGTEMRSLATILNFPTTLTSLASGTEMRSLATILGGVIGASLPTTQTIGSLNSLASIYGLVGNAVGANYIGLVTVAPMTFGATAFANAFRMAGATSIDVTNNYGKGVMVFTTVPSSASGTVLTTIRAKDPVSGNYISLLSGATLPPPGSQTTQLLMIYPGITVSGLTQLSLPLPSVFNIQTTVGTATASYSVGYSVID